MPQLKAGVMMLRGMLRRRKLIIVFAMVALGFLTYSSTLAQVSSITGSDDVDAALSFSMMPMNMLILALALIYTLFGQLMGMLISMAIGMIVVPILGYNNFAHSTVIDIGWPLVRDIVNMFVIIILLVIAIKTMVGGEKGSAAASQNLVRFFLAIVAVNFSRTICVLAIDASQVVMFTFVNSIRDIAAGNFINLFQLQTLFSWDTIYESFTGTAGLGPRSYLITSYLTLIILSMVFMILAIMAVVFLYRIIILWVLVIMSPMAFFMMGIKDVVPSAGNSAGKWLSKFTGALMVGPILVFFLWLGLAVASQGSIATTEAFPPGGEIDGFGQVFSDIFQIDKMLSMIIGLILMIVGFQAAAESAAKLGSFSEGLISEKSGMNLGKSLAMFPATAAGRAGAYAGRGAAFGANQFDRRVGSNGERLSTQVGREFAEFGGGMLAQGGIIGNTVGRGLIAGGARIEKAGQEMTKQDLSAAQDRVSNMTSTQRKAIRDSMQGSGALQGGELAFSQSDMDTRRVIAADYALDTKQQERDIKDKTDEYKQKAIKEATQANIVAGDSPDIAAQKAERGVDMDAARSKAEGDIEMALAPFDALSEGEKKTIVGQAKTDNLFAASMGRLHRTGGGEMGGLSTKEYNDLSKEGKDRISAERISEINTKMEKGEFTPAMLTPRALRDPDVAKAMETATMPNQFDKNDKPMTVAGYIRAGRAGQSLKKTMDGPANFDKGRAGGIKDGLEKGGLEVASIEKVHLSSPERINEIAEGMAQSSADLGDVRRLKPEQAATLVTEMDRKIAEQQMIVDKQELKDYTKPDSADNRQTKSYSEGDRRSAIGKIQEYKQAKFGLSTGAEAQKIIGIGDDGTVPPAQRAMVGAIMKNTPVQAGKLSSLVTTEKSQLTSAMVEGMTDKSIESMRTGYGDASSLGNTGRASEIKASVEVHERAIAAEISALEPEKTGKDKGEVRIPPDLRKKRNRIRLLKRDMARVDDEGSESGDDGNTDGEG